jgi:hypothetical protein
MWDAGWSLRHVVWYRSQQEVQIARTITGGASKTFLTFAASFIVYMIALVSFVGWFLFAVRRVTSPLHPMPGDCLQHQVTCKRCPVTVCSMKSSAADTLDRAVTHDDNLLHATEHDRGHCCRCLAAWAWRRCRWSSSRPSRRGPAS